MNTLDFYNDAIKPLPPDERLRLAAMILNDATAVPPADAVPYWELEGYSDEWTDEDIADFSKASLARFGLEEGDQDEVDYDA